MNLKTCKSKIELRHEDKWMVKSQMVTCKLYGDSVFSFELLREALDMQIKFFFGLLRPMNRDSNTLWLRW